MEGKEAPPGGFEVYAAQLRAARETFCHQRVYDPQLRQVVPLAPQPAGSPPMPHCCAYLPPHLAVAICEEAAIHPETHEPLRFIGEPEPAPAAAPSAAGLPISSSLAAPQGSAPPTAIPRAATAATPALT